MHNLMDFLAFRFSREGAWDKAARDPNDEMVSAGLTPDNIRKWEFLTGIQGENETVGGCMCKVARPDPWKRQELLGVLEGGGVFRGKRRF